MQILHYASTTKTFSSALLLCALNASPVATGPVPGPHSTYTGPPAKLISLIMYMTCWKAWDESNKEDVRLQQLEKPHTIIQTLDSWPDGDEDSNEVLPLEHWQFYYPTLDHVPCQDNLNLLHILDTGNMLPFSSQIFIERVLLPVSVLPAISSSSCSINYLPPLPNLTSLNSAVTWQLFSVDGLLNGTGRWVARPIML